MTSVTINGSLVGGSAPYSGTLELGGNVTTLAILGDVRGGDASSSGNISVEGTATTVTINGSLIGGRGHYSGNLSGLTLTNVTINGSIRGGSATGLTSLIESGTVRTQLRLGTLTLGGSLIAGRDDTNGEFHRNGAIFSLGEMALSL